MLSQERRSSLIKGCLSRLYILQCGTPLQLLASLQSMPSLIETDPRVRLVILDNITSIYWHDGHIDNKAVTQKGACRCISASLKTQMVSLIRGMLLEHPHVVVVALKGVLFYHATGVSGEYMDRDWQQLATHRFVLEIKVCCCCLLLFDVAGAISGHIDRILTATGADDASRRLTHCCTTSDDV